MGVVLSDRGAPVFRRVALNGGPCRWQPPCGRDLSGSAGGRWEPSRVGTGPAARVAAQDGRRSKVTSGAGATGPAERWCRGMPREARVSPSLTAPGHGRRQTMRFGGGAPRLQGGSQHRIQGSANESFRRSVSFRPARMDVGGPRVTGRRFPRPRPLPHRWPGVLPVWRCALRGRSQAPEALTRPTSPSARQLGG